MTLQEIENLTQSNRVTLRDNILYLMLAAMGGGASNTPSPTVIDSVVATVSDEIHEGALAVTFATSDDFIGTINGITRQAGSVYTFNPTTFYLLPIIPYTITQGNIQIDSIFKA